MSNRAASRARPRRFSQRAFLAFGLALALLVPGVALGHNGYFPISTDLFLRNGLMWVPSPFFGIFVGRPGEPWHWICGEAINKDQSRRWAQSGSGTFHVTDYAGVTSSVDGGCTWTAATGEIATRATRVVVADPVDPKRAWATTYSGMAYPWNGLFVTPDDGLTWTAVLQVDEYLVGPAISADGSVLYVVGVPRHAAGDPIPILHVSKDHGTTFQDLEIDLKIGDHPPSDVIPFNMDPSDPSIVYLMAYREPVRVLARATGFGEDLTEILRLESEMYGVTFDPSRNAVLVPTRQGLMRSVGGGPFVATGGLAQSQCAQVRGNDLIACTFGLSPADPALVQSSDGGEHFQTIYRYTETTAAWSGCPASSPVAMICPALWPSYDYHFLPLPVLPDGGTDDGGTDVMGAPSHTAGCHIGRSRPGAVLGWMSMAALCACYRWSKKRGRRVPAAAGSTPPGLDI